MLLTPTQAPAAAARAAAVALQEVVRLATPLPVPEATARRAPVPAPRGPTAVLRAGTARAAAAEVEALALPGVVPEVPEVPESSGLKHQTAHRAGREAEAAVQDMPMQEQLATEAMVDSMVAVAGPRGVCPEARWQAVQVSVLRELL